MSERLNHLGQPVGEEIPDWTPCVVPPKTALDGRHCRLEPFGLADRARELFEAFSKDADQSNWTYLPVGPFEDFASFSSWVKDIHYSEDPMFHAVVDGRSGKAVGVASYLRITPNVGVIEVGYIHFSPLMQRTALSTEAMYLMMSRVFDELGYRRYEWKCDALNAPSRKAALRLGFTFEGIFRQATINKGRNRDTAWYSILDSEWPQIKRGFQTWLAPENFDASGKQRVPLQALMRTV